MVNSGPGKRSISHRLHTALIEENFADRFMNCDDVMEDIGAAPSANAEHMGIETAAAQWRDPPLNVTRLNITVEADGSEKILTCGSMTNEERKALLQGIFHNLDQNTIQQGTRHEGYRDYDNSGNDRQSNSPNASKHSPQEVGEELRSSRTTRQRKSKSSSPNYGQTLSTRLLTIGNHDEVGDFYWQCFKDIQQNNCKIIAKPWIKAINPNKQTNNPYAGGPTRAPWWWPPRPPNGVAPSKKNGYVRHTEPDHLKTDERKTLLVTILKLVTGAIPYNPSQGQHLHNVDVKRLEREATEALGDKMDGEDHKLKRDTLKELFKVARTAERYYNNEIDASVAVTVRNFHDRPSPDGASASPVEGLRFEDMEDVTNNVEVPSYGMHTSSTGMVPNQGSHPQELLQARSLNNNMSHGLPTGVEQLRVRSSQRQGMVDPLSYTHTSDNHSHLLGHSSPLARVSGNYQQTSPYLQESVRRPTWATSTSHSPNPFFSNYSTANNYPLQYHNYPSVTVGQSASHGSFLPIPISMSLPAMNLQQHQIFNDGHSTDKDLRMGNHGPVQLPIHGFQDFLTNPDYTDSDMKENQPKSTRYWERDMH